MEHWLWLFMGLVAGGVTGWALGRGHSGPCRPLEENDD